MRKNQQQTDTSKARISNGMRKMIAKRKKEGKSWGRPKGIHAPSFYDGKEAFIAELLHMGYTKKRIAIIRAGEYDQLISFTRCRDIQPKEQHLPLKELTKQAGLPTFTKTR